MENFADLQSLCLKVFSEVAKTTSVFILPLFLLKVIMANVLGEGASAFQTLKGVVIYFLLISGFPIILDVLFSIPKTFLPEFQSIDNISKGYQETDGLALLPFALDKVMETGLAFLYWVVYYLHIFFMILMCSMAPVVFLTTTLLGVGIGIEIFMGLMIIGSSWPILWHGFDQVHGMIASSTADPFAIKCLELMMTAGKGLAPVALSLLAIKSPAGQMVAKAITPVTVPTRFAGQKGIQMAHSSFQKMTNNQSHNPHFHKSTSRISNSRPQRSSEGLRKVERSDFERLLGDRFKRPTKPGSEK